MPVRDRNWGKKQDEIKKYDLTDKGVVSACHANGAKLRITAVPTTGSFRQFIDDVTHRRRRDYLVCAGAFLVALPLLVWAGVLTAQYGPTITAAQAQQLPEFGPTGRTRFFTPNPFVTTLNYQDDNGSNNYHGLQMQVQKDAGHGFIGAANFTWSP